MSFTAALETRDRAYHMGPQEEGAGLVRRQKQQKSAERLGRAFFLQERQAGQSK